MTQKGGSHQGQHHSHTVVDDLRHQLKSTTKEFKDVLTLRSQHLKDQTERRQMFSAVPENGFHESTPLLESSASSSKPLLQQK